MNKPAMWVASMGFALLLVGCDDKQAPEPAADASAPVQTASAPAAPIVYGDSLTRTLSQDRYWTQVGERQDAKLVSNGNAGYLLFGPYVPLQAGTYNLLIKGDVEALADGGKVRIDVASAKGKAIHGGQDVTDKGALPSFDVVLPADAADVEVRVQVPQDARVSVEAYQLVKKG